MVDQPFKLKVGFPTSSQGAQSSSVHRCFPKGLGCSLKASHSQWSVESGEVPGLHINILELKAVFLALKSFEIILNRNLLISTDNSSVVASLNKQGGTHSQEMCALFWRMMTWTNARGIQIRTKFIPGNLNILADSLSRKGKVIQTEWVLNHRCSIRFAIAGINQW